MFQYGLLFCGCRGGMNQSLLATIIIIGNVVLFLLLLAGTVIKELYCLYYRDKGCDYEANSDNQHP